MMKHRAYAFQDYVPKVMEMVMRCQDPAASSEYDRCHWVCDCSLIDDSCHEQIAVDILHNLAQESPRISYLPLLLRVAVGNDDGSVVVYDVKTSAKLFVRTRRI